MRTLDIVACLVLALAAVVLTACGGTQAMETIEDASISDTGDVVGAVREGELDGGQATATGAEISTAEAATELDADYEGALDEGAQLALGTLLLEETAQSLTPEQAGRLLPLWQALQGGVTAEAEVEAVVAGIKQVMTSEQLTAIADMALTQNDAEAWMQDRGGEFGVPDGSGEPTGERPTGGEGRAGMGSMSEEEREAMRAAMRATVQAGGELPTGASAPGGSAGQYGMLIRPLVTMLDERAGEA